RDATIPDDYSQLLLFNYNTGERIALTAPLDKKEDFYFDWLSSLFISPHFTNIIYAESSGKTIPGTGYTLVEYYVSNRATMKIKKLHLPYASQPNDPAYFHFSYLDDDTVLYSHKNSIYKYTISTDTIETLPLQGELLSD